MTHNAALRVTYTTDVSNWVRHRIFNAKL